LVIVELHVLMDNTDAPHRQGGWRWIGTRRRRVYLSSAPRTRGGDFITSDHPTRAIKPARTFVQGGCMTKRWIIAALAAASVAATALPAAAQGGHRSGHDGWAQGNWDNWRGGPSFGVGVTVGAPAYNSWGYDTYAADWSYPGGYAYRYGEPAYDYGYRDYAYDEPGFVGVRFGSNSSDYAYVGGTTRYWDGRDYCWYDDGWRGAGWYRCGFQLRVGYGWGGPWGWHGWSGGRRGEFREGRGEFRERGVVRGSVRERGEIRGNARIREGAEFRDNVRSRTSVRERSDVRGSASIRERGEIRGNASIRERGDVRASSRSGASVRERGSVQEGTTGMGVRGNSELRGNSERGNRSELRGGANARGGAAVNGTSRVGGRGGAELDGATR
jgi:hypothetical protein